MVLRAAFLSVLRLLALWTAMAGFGELNAQPAFMTNGLVAFYPFNGDAKDASGHNLNAQVFNVANVIAAADRFNVPNAAFEFRQKINNIEPVIWGQGINLANKPLTISYWIKGDFTTIGLGLAGVNVGTIPPGTPNPGGSTGKNLHAFVNYVYQGIIRFAFFSDDFDLPVNTLPGDQWNQMVFVYDKDAAVKRIAINGVVASTKSASFGFSGNDLFSIIGVNGVRIDDVRFYERALSSAEIGQLYNHELVPQSPTPRGATAIAQVVNGFVVGLTITDGGFGYTNAPGVVITGGGGAGATATARITNGSVVSVSINNPGSGYTSLPTVSIDPPPFPPRRATAAAQVVNGFVVGLTLVDGGYGYSEAPDVRLVGGGGSGAIATGIVQNGVLTGFTILNPGSGYTSAPTVRIASPPFAPSVSIEVSKVAVRLKVVQGRRYQLESSANLQEWAAVGESFVAELEDLEEEFDVRSNGAYFRIRQVP